MKIKNGFMLREIAEQWVVVPIGERVVEFNGIMTLSETGRLLWKSMENSCTEEDLVKVILSEYDIDEETAKEDVKAFVTNVTEMGLVDSE